MLPRLASRIAFGLIGVLACSAGEAVAQRPPVHYHYSADAPTGVLGKAQLMRGGPLAGYFQPVEVRAPEGAAIALAEDGRFGEPQDTSSLVGLLIGHVYHLKITQIPLNEGKEVFPTIELLDRLYPPEGQELRFPIPIDLTIEELDHAANGRFVTRVIYIEDPRRAVAAVEDPRRVRYFEVGKDQDPLEVADRIGRPVAILRIGSRVPTDEDLLDGKVAMSPFMKYRRQTTKAPTSRIIPPVDKDIPKSDFHENVPRDDFDQRWTIRPTVLLPQNAPPRKVR